MFRLVERDLGRNLSVLSPHVTYHSMCLTACFPAYSQYTELGGNQRQAS